MLKGHEGEPNKNRMKNREHEIRKKTTKFHQNQYRCNFSNEVKAIQV